MNLLFDTLDIFMKLAINPKIIKLLKDFLVLILNFIVLIFNFIVFTIFVVTITF